MQRVKTWRRRVTAAALTVAVIATATACRSSSGSAAEAPSKGGTLYVYVSTHPVTNLDPQGVGYAGDGNISRLIDRTLTTTTANGEIVPDLATDTGRPNADNSVWDFTLKSGLRWEDGKPVTCQDVKYGVERRFLKAIDQYQGLPYPLTYLVDNKPHYQGPITQNDSLNSIKCIDNNNIEFHLASPAGDFGYTVSVSTFAPVEFGAKVEKFSDYNWHPMSNGPYKLDYTTPGATSDPKAGPDGVYYLPKLTLVRNNYWSAQTDPVRKANPDKIVIQYVEDNAQLTYDLINSSGNYANAISLDSEVAPNFVQQVINDPVLSKRVLTGPTTAVRYFAINTRRITNLQCRKALEYGFDKHGWRFVLGGAPAADLATSMIPPKLPAHEDFDLYETNTQPSGDSIKAAKMIKDNHCKTSLSIAAPVVPNQRLLLASVVRAYAKIGVEVTPHLIPPQSYIGSVNQLNSPYDMALLGWVPDWPNGSAVIPPLFDSKQLGSSSNLNLSMLDDPDINQGIAAALKEPSIQVQYRLWGDLDRQILDKAAVIPILNQRALRMYGSNVRGVELDQAYSQPDLATIGLAAGSS